MATINRGESVEDFDDRTLMDTRLFKFIGLYHIINPSENGHRYRRIISTILWLLLVCQSARIYLSFVHVEMAVYFLVSGCNVIMCFYKGQLMLKHWDELRVMLNVSRFTFTTCGVKYPDTLIQCQGNIRTILRNFSGVSYSLIVFWFAYPNLVKMSFGQYNNLSETFWRMTFVLDSFVVVMTLLMFTIFANFLVTMCISIDAQFKIVTAAYESLGYRKNSQLSSSSFSNLNLKSDETNKIIYDDLIYIIQDNQKLIEKFNDFINIIRPVMIIQIINSSISSVGFIFISLMTYLSGWALISAPVMIFFVAFFTVTLELFMYCYVLCHLEESKSKVNFGLYSSNWTEMDIKFKKMLLLTMKMNSTNQNIIKISPKNIINLELFARVMNTNYTILTVLLNTMAK